MIQTQELVLESGATVIRTYSDTDHRIVQNGTGIVYDEAVDPADANRTYTESIELIDHGPPPDGLDAAASYLLENDMMTMPEPDPEPDYLNEHEPESDYFAE